MVGVGVSCYLGSAKQLESYNSVPSMRHTGEAFTTAPRLEYHEQSGLGYGVQATLGIRADVNRHVYLLAQGRARYVDGLAFAANDYNFHSEFTKIDFAIGFGFKF